MDIIEQIVKDSVRENFRKARIITAILITLGIFGALAYPPISILFLAYIIFVWLITLNVNSMLKKL